MGSKNFNIQSGGEEDMLTYTHTQTCTGAAEDKKQKLFLVRVSLCTQMRVLPGQLH